MTQALAQLVARMPRLHPEQWRLVRTFGFLFGVTLLGLFLILAVFILYSAAADWHPWAIAHLWRILVGLGIVLAIVMTPITAWLRYAYWLYGFNLFLLILLPVLGVSSMGAQRWFAIGALFLQPSEPMKIFLILALARYFHALPPGEIAMPSRLILPTLITLLPVVLVAAQPDLGTSLLVLFVGVIVFFFAGVRWWKFASLAIIAIVSVPLAWHYTMHEFQRQRILSFLSPENDLLGAGYQLMQSKIAIGAGGLFGLGFLQGSQSLLGFIPAKHTDFVFALYAEQFGFLGSILLLLLLLLLLIFTLQTARVIHSTFGRLVVLTIGSLWLIQSLINLAMVMGLLPVVGIPLPFLSYGGTSLWTSMGAFGLLLNMYINQYNPLRSAIIR